MPFIIIAHDETDAEALNRRMEHRPAHLATIKESVEAGKQVFGCAMLGDTGKMKGSVMVMNYDTREEVDAWLAREPFVTGKVWGNVEIIPIAVPDLFGHLFPKK